MTDKSNDERFMRAALREARKAFGKTSPNPAVGAVLVDGKKIIAQGFHRGPGQPHAEIECLRGVSAKARARSTLYVTLEPCSTAGRTGACTEALIAGGIKHVVVGAIDPNPRHNGRGLARLREAGVEARSGILAAECAALNEAFNKWTVTGLPFVIAKCGMGLDGCLTRPPDEPRWITSPAARRDGRLLRARMDAVLIGAETLRADNPRLTAREERGSRQPWRIILTRSGKLPANARVFRDRFRDRTVVFRNEKLENVLRELGRREITSVLIEGGGQILAEALDARLIDQFQIYIGPILTGGPVVAFPGDGAANSSDALRLERVTYRRIENDICVTGFAAVERRKDKIRNFTRASEFNEQEKETLTEVNGMKKFFLIAVAALGLVIAAAPSSKAGVSVGIGFGGPFYPGYGPYGYGYPYYYGPGVRFVHRPYYWYHGRRVYRHRWH